MQGAKRGKVHKFACSFDGPYCLLEQDDNRAEVVLIGKPNSMKINLSHDRLRKGPQELGKPDKVASEGGTKPSTPGWSPSM